MQILKFILLDGKIIAAIFLYFLFPSPVPFAEEFIISLYCFFFVLEINISTFLVASGMSILHPSGYNLRTFTRIIGGKWKGTLGPSHW